MKAVITGDIIHSREMKTEVWMPILKESLQLISPYWEIFRGDSFQFVTEAEDALWSSFVLKARLKQLKVLDVRLAIGLGEISYQTTQMTESNGTAFIHSGECFDELKKRTLAIKSFSSSFDYTMNLLLFVASKFCNEWTQATALAIETALRFPSENQSLWAERIGKSQSTVNEALKRAGYEEVKQIIDYYNQSIQKL